MNSAAFHSLEWPRMTFAEASSAEEGSGEVGEEIDDEDEHEGSSKNEAHLSEITGSGDFGKKRQKQGEYPILIFFFFNFCNLNFLIAPFVHLLG